MIKFLVPVDGSECANRAVEHLIRLIGGTQPAEIHLLNVRNPVDAWEVKRFLTEEEIIKTQIDKGEVDLQSARALLDAAGLTYNAHIEIGPIASTIVKLATDLACDAIIMGTRGRGDIAKLVLGSIATKVIYLAEIPVTLVK